MKLFFANSVCILAIVRLVLLINTTRTPGSDITWNTASNTYWTCVEVNLAIACACGVTLKPLIVRRFPRLFGVDRTAKPVPLARVPATNHRLPPRIDSWIDFPGTLDGFEFYGKEANLSNDESVCRRDIHYPGLAHGAVMESVADWGSNIGIAMSDEWTEGQLRPEHDELTIWKEAHPIGDLSEGFSQGTREY